MKIKSLSLEIAVIKSENLQDELILSEWAKDETVIESLGATLNCNSGNITAIQIAFKKKKAGERINKRTMELADDIVNRWKNAEAGNLKIPDGRLWILKTMIAESLLTERINAIKERR